MRLGFILLILPACAFPLPNGATIRPIPANCYCLVDTTPGTVATTTKEPKPNTLKELEQKVTKAKEKLEGAQSAVEKEKARE